ncbi:MAG TPA: FAD-binding oxidoreductase [Burkholderiales bacterium]|nr:FAD-binding oxidoreductase [Burkholderiales bacterium]
MLCYAERRDELIRQIRGGRGSNVGLGKPTSNLFRSRERAPRQRLDVSTLHHVLDVDAREGWVNVEAMTPYDALTAVTLEHGVMPCVVPQLKSITIGGAVAGVGIESSSFRYGLVHETLLELEVLLGDGSVVTATPDNEHRDLFFGFPNSYGTLGYALRVKTRVAPVKRFVVLSHLRHSGRAAYFGQLAELCQRPDIDFIDGSVFAPDELYITLGRFVDQAPYCSDYTFERIYYRSIRERETDYLTAAAYLWRWDTDWFWCSKNLAAQNPVVRRLLGRRRLNSRFYTKLMRFNSRWRLMHTLDRLRGQQRESVIQDVDIPIEHAAEFLEFFHREIGILPVWICPIRRWNPGHHWTLYPMDGSTTFVNFGFWDVVRSRQAHVPGHFNRLLERKVQELGGIKSLYSDSYFTPAEFWTLYDGEAYRALKQRYDPDGRFQDLYAKCVLHA